MGPKVVPDTKNDRPADRRSQHQLNSTQLNSAQLRLIQRSVGDCIDGCVQDDTQYLTLEGLQLIF
jgi:hypothetical protein